MYDIFKYRRYTKKYLVMYDFLLWLIWFMVPLGIHRYIRERSLTLGEGKSIEIS